MRLPILRVGYPTIDHRMLRTVTLEHGVWLEDRDGSHIAMLTQFEFREGGWLSAFGDVILKPGTGLEAGLMNNKTDWDEEHQLLIIDGHLNYVRLGDRPAWPEAVVP